MYIEMHNIILILTGIIAGTALFSFYSGVSYAAKRITIRFYVLEKSQFSDEARKKLDSGDAGFVPVATAYRAEGKFTARKDRKFKVIRSEEGDGKENK